MIHATPEHAGLFSQQLDASVETRLHQLLEEHDQVLLAIVGAPGAGKSTLAEAIIDYALARDIDAVWLPMDGYHLADVELDRLGRLSRKGALDTFDGYGYVNTLERIIRKTAPIVYVPAFDREIEQPVAGSIPVPTSARLIVTEGNYLLESVPPWNQIRDLVTETWFCDVDDDLRRERLIARHVRFGKTAPAARAWVTDIDERNAVGVRATAVRADLRVHGDRDGTWRVSTSTSTHRK